MAETGAALGSAAGPADAEPVAAGPGDAGRVARTAPPTTTATPRDTPAIILTVPARERRFRWRPLERATRLDTLPHWDGKLSGHSMAKI